MPSVLPDVDVATGLEPDVALSIAFSNAALYALWLASTTTHETTASTTPAIDNPLASCLPRRAPTSAMTANTPPMMAIKNEMLLMMGKNEVTAAMMPSTRPAMARPELCFVVVWVLSDSDMGDSLPLTCGAPIGARFAPHNGRQGTWFH